MSDLLQELENPLEMAHSHALRIIEALLFASNTPLSINRIRTILENFYSFKNQEVVALLSAFKKQLDEEKRPIMLEEVADGFILKTRPAYSEYVHELYKDRKGERLSTPAREVLAIIAFKQPLTRAQIESVRGVDSSGTIQALMERGLIEAAGQLDTPGKPTLLRVSQTFLNHFGLKDIEELRAYLPQ